jgi:hypothetical protein
MPGSGARAIDAIIEAPGCWRSITLARLRAVILSADASIVDRPGNSGLLLGDDFSDPREGAPGRCLDGLSASRQYDPIVL